MRVGRRDIRPRAALAALLVVLVGGAVIAMLRGDSAGRAQPELEQRFEQGVVMLHARQYEYAAAAFGRVLEIAPQLPEARVNMGYAMIGLKRFDEARDFFESATAIRPGQVNAYYGLAVALEGMGDLRGAVGSMRTYVHLSPSDDPYLRKAQSALWEWETELGKRR